MKALSVKKLTTKTARFAFLSALTVTAIANISQLAAAQMTIDDFSTGAYSKTLTKGTDSNTQTGTMAGGSRTTYLFVCGGADPCSSFNPFYQPNSFQVKPATKTTPSAMIFNTGYKSGANLQFGYGYGSPMNLNLSQSYDRIRLYFDGADQSVNFNVVVFTNGNNSTIGCNFSDPGTLTPFTVEVPFANFAGSADFSDITQMWFEFDVAQGIATGGDWAVTSIEAVYGTVGGNNNIVCGGGTK